LRRKVMISWRSLLVLSVLAAFLTACCCPLGSLLGEAEFTTGALADVPAYPGARQTTETNTIINALVAALSLVAEDSEWKHYVTSESEGVVLGWYEDTLPGYGWALTEFEDVEVEGGLFFVKATEPATTLYIGVMPDVEGGDELDIVIGRLKLAVEFEE
jgi:hypothetical protein